MTSKSEAHLSGHVAQKMTSDNIHLYRITRAAGRAETLLGLAAKTKWDEPRVRLADNK